MSLICVPITALSTDSALAAAYQAQAAGADLIEFRIDTWADPATGPSAKRKADVATLVQQSPLPVIITCRIAAEGGGHTGSNLDRMPLYEAAADAGAAYVDIELAAYLADGAFRTLVDTLPITTKLILSTHDFETRPSDLTRRVTDMLAIDRCDVIKAAWTARSLRDNLEAFELIVESAKPAVMLCMGEMGLPSRALAKKAGAAFTFAKLDDDKGTAPGQPTVADLKTLYRWGAQTPQTVVYGVIGMPVGHSMSPPIHNAGFDTISPPPPEGLHASGGGGVYLPMPIADSYESFKATAGAWLDAPTMTFRGASVTIPHKANLLRFVEEQGGEIEPLAATIGAANTLTVDADGNLRASNTDYAAILDSITHVLSCEREELKGQRVAVLGAGGAARAAVAGFASLGAHITIYNRTPGKAEALAEAFAETAATAGGSISAQSIEALKESLAQIYINCTPIGMHPKVDASPFDNNQPELGAGTVIFDTIYNPIETKLLKQAWHEGCLPIPGTEMFVRQAAVQFEGWTGCSAPLDVFRRVLSDKLQQKDNTPSGDDAPSKDT